MPSNNFIKTLLATQETCASFHQLWQYELFITQKWSYLKWFHLPSLSPVSFHTHLTGQSNLIPAKAFYTFQLWQWFSVPEFTLWGNVYRYYINWTPMPFIDRRDVWGRNFKSSLQKLPCRQLTHSDGINGSGWNEIVSFSKEPGIPL